MAVGLAIGGVAQLGLWISGRAADRAGARVGVSMSQNQAGVIAGPTHHVEMAMDSSELEIASRSYEDAAMTEDGRFREWDDEWGLDRMCLVCGHDWMSGCDGKCPCLRCRAEWHPLEGVELAGEMG
jgi:hypothetical protein